MYTPKVLEDGSACHISHPSMGGRRAVILSVMPLNLAGAIEISFLQVMGNSKSWSSTSEASTRILASCALNACRAISPTSGVLVWTLVSFASSVCGVGSPTFGPRVWLQLPLLGVQAASFLPSRHMDWILTCFPHLAHPLVEMLHHQLLLECLQAARSLLS